jgi:SnoaL-like polyketide cyclase
MCARAARWAAGWIAAGSVALITGGMALAYLDRVVQRITCYGTRLGEFCGGRPTGGQAAFASIEINRAGADGRFTGHWSWADLPGVLHRLGVAPELSPASAPKG